MDDHFYEPAHGHGLAHNPFKAIVAPRPIGWISTRSRSGAANLAPYSFFNAIHDSPPIVAFATSAQRKDSLNNLEETGEFVVNFVGAHHAQAMNATAASVPHGVSEFTLAGLEEAPCRLLAAPRVAGAVAAMECRVSRILQIPDARGGTVDGWLTIGEVVGVHVNRAFIRDGSFDTAAAGMLGRCGGPGDYVQVRELFQMTRPR